MKTAKALFYLFLLVALTASAKAQYSGGTGRGDASDILISALLPVQENPAKVPVNYELEQNYPNPFNPGTVISFSLPERAHILIRVFDLLGKEVCTLIDEDKSAGTFSITFGAGDLASGIYFYQIRTGEFIQTKKMIIEK